MITVNGCLDRPEMWEDALVRDKAARKTFAAGGTGNAGSDTAPVVPNTVAQDTGENIRLATV